ncbi:SNF2 family N-terminal domain-containing protein [Stachybotrys elegans]|uniref:SNF2 family N-terminal domain-containing protein n=1 Tax=Stachybotrys elegans TaxID=80388 RepID=A0A8K0SQQ8_9HYPO|nr:SNF2 family N-terminal domain-containing protein [Stachybotrys elegans]
MNTPSRANDIWSSPSHRLPSRKRDATLTGFDSNQDRNKSRRTTPTPSGPFSSPSYSRPHNDDFIDFIDLTGDDVDKESFIAEQVRQFERNEQEKRDRDMALQLSSQNDDYAPSHQLAAGSSHQPQNNAFRRMMPLPQERPSHLPSTPSQPSGHSVSPSANGQPNHLPGQPYATAIPGAYDPAWDNDSSSQLTANHTQRAPQVMRYHTSGRPKGGWDPYELQVPWVYSSTNQGDKIQGQGPSAANNTPAFRSAASQLRHASSQPHHASYSMPRVGRDSSLMDIISSTSMFDYSTGTDVDGHPLSDRLTDLFNDAFHDPRVTEKELDDLLQNIRPDMEPGLNRGNTPEALKNSLYPHQELALSWMVKMEEGSNKGGILADDMGLGKTISTLALIHARPATARPKTNLIIGPLSLIRQWEEEIGKKTKPSHRLSVFVYHNRRKTTTEELLQHDVVLTTYGTIAQELKRLEKYHKDNEGRNIDYNDRTLAIQCPLLHPRKATFYRVILDEAQCIKNQKTKTANACQKLKSTYRWCLTGTPMMNGVLELYSLVNFLRIKPYCVWDNFRNAFGILFGKRGDSKNVAMSRLRALLKAIMLRRKKDSQLDGKPILRLPEKTEEVVYARLSPEEQDFYDQLEHKSQVQFSKYLREGSVGKNYSSILVLLLRLRQACCHPHLNVDVEDVQAEVNEDMEKVVKDLDAMTIKRIKEAPAFECPICQDAVPCPSFFVPCGHDVCAQCLVRLVDDAATNNLREGNESNMARCPMCRGPFDPRKCFTYDAFQKVHMPSEVKKDSGSADEDSETEDDSEYDSESNYASDDEVDGNGDLRNFIVPDDDIESSDDDSKKPKLEDVDRKEPPSRKKKSKKGKGKKEKQDIKPSMLKSLRKEASKNREAFRKYMRYLRKTWLPAAKLDQCMLLLKQIQETGEKTIIFSQWTLLLDLLEVAMWHDKLDKPIRYDGSMSGEERNVAAHRFREDRKYKVMLVSLRAGNAGLNLTSASRVIIMDPFWNPYIEMQAVDRAYRIGQQRPVKVYRILTKDTVEDRIVALQEKKKEMVEAALDETESMKIGRLTANELKFLFNTR